jgi:hypothetical protein
VANVKRIIIAFLIILLLLPFHAFTAAPSSVEEAVRLANEEIESQYGMPDYYDISKVNKAMWEKYGALVYGSPHGDKKGNDQRYIGYTPDGVPFGSPTFPRDAWTGGTRGVSPHGLVEAFQ